MTRKLLLRRIGMVTGSLAAVGLTYIAFMTFINPYLPWTPDPTLNPDPNHTHADFAVWINGEALDFSDAKYMSGVSTDDTSHDEEGEYLHPYLHLHDEIGYVIHRHKPGLTIGDFLGTIGFTMTPDCLTTDAGNEYCTAEGEQRWLMFVNGEAAAFNPGYEFKDIDKILLTYGASRDDLQKQFKAMTDDACRFSKACPWRGEPPAENCIADPSIPCGAPLVEDDFS